MLFERVVFILCERLILGMSKKRSKQSSAFKRSGPRNGTLRGSKVKELPCFEKKSAILMDSPRGFEMSYLLAVYRLRWFADPTLTGLTYSLSRPVIG